MAFFWISAFLGAMVGGLVLLITISTSAGAPQEAAGAAIACALAVLPYVAARSLSELRADRPVAARPDSAPRPIAAPVSADVTAANRRALLAVVGFMLLAAILWGAAVVYRDLM